jgi:hypothetical protein
MRLRPSRAARQVSPRSASSRADWSTSRLRKAGMRNGGSKQGFGSRARTASARYASSWASTGSSSISAPRQVARPLRCGSGTSRPHRCLVPRFRPCSATIPLVPCSENRNDSGR